ncbi:MAG: MbnP family protein [Bacteroidia bacterium]
MKNKIIVLVIFSLKWSGIFAQVNINFKPLFGKEILVLNKQYFVSKTVDSIQIENLQLYISNIELYKNNELVFKENNSFHLLNAADSNSLTLPLTSISNLVFDQIKFNIGIDSITNYGGAMGGDLDPTKGMYWTWQNGYINFKIEGKSKLCKANNNEFTFHLGGYLYPFNTLQNIQLASNNLHNIPINIALDKWFSEIDLGKQNHIMSPSKDAVLLSNKLSTIFSVSQ